MYYHLTFELFFFFFSSFFSSGTNITHPAAIHLMSKTRYILHRYYLGEKKKVFAEKKKSMKKVFVVGNLPTFTLLFDCYIQQISAAVVMVVVAKDSLPSLSLSNYRILKYQEGTHYVTIFQGFYVQVISCQPLHISKNSTRSTYDLEFIQNSNTNSSI